MEKTKPGLPCGILWDFMDVNPSYIYGKENCFPKCSSSSPPSLPAHISWQVAGVCVPFCVDNILSCLWLIRVTIWVAQHLNPFPEFGGIHHCMKLGRWKCPVPFNFPDRHFYFCLFPDSTSYVAGAWDLRSVRHGTVPLERWLREVEDALEFCPFRVQAAALVAMYRARCGDQG